MHRVTTRGKGHTQEHGTCSASHAAGSGGRNAHASHEQTGVNELPCRSLS